MSLVSRNVTINSSLGTILIIRPLCYIYIIQYSFSHVRLRFSNNLNTTTISIKRPVTSLKMDSKKRKKQDLSTHLRKTNYGFTVLILSFYYIHLPSLFVVSVSYDIMIKRPSINRPVYIKITVVLLMKIQVVLLLKMDCTISFLCVVGDICIVIR